MQIYSTECRVHQNTFCGLTGGKEETKKTKSPIQHRIVNLLKKSEHKNQKKKIYIIKKDSPRFIFALENLHKHSFHEAYINSCLQADAIYSVCVCVCVCARELIGQLIHALTMVLDALCWQLLLR